MKSKTYQYEGKTITITYDVKRCIHAAKCVHGLPDVFDPKARPWVAPDAANAQAVADVVVACPSGALHYDGEGVAPEAVPDANTVHVQANGPLYVRGDVTITDAEGTTVLKDTRLALCRCGQSKNKPLCDNSHLDGFADAGVLGTANLKTPDAGPGLKVSPARNGPLLFDGPLTIHGTDGSTNAGTRAALCRCGHSSNKPFCDGTHRSVGFTAD